MIKETAAKIKAAQSILLTTHRQCDGDGLGSELALYHALRKVNKNVRIINVDATPQKYDFLQPDTFIQYFDGPHDPIAKTDLALVFDTNDRRLIEPLYKELEKNCGQIIFVDHHPILKEGPAPSKDSIIMVKAASTGEITYDLIQELGIPLDLNIARALYTSLVFDTQLFRYIRNSPRSHEVAAHLLHFEKEPALIHKKLFGNFTASKVRFLAEALREIEFHFNEQLAILLVRSLHLKELGLDVDDTRDIIDMVMNIETVEAAAVFREDGANSYKLSLRSKGRFPVLDVAEKVGGGGHPYASGATLTGSFADFKKVIVDTIGAKIKKL